MTFSEDQLAEVKPHCVQVALCEEGGVSGLLLIGLVLPAGCSPQTTDALLIPMSHSGYPSRLFFAQRIAPAGSAMLNWNASGVRIFERNWQAFSWNVTRPGLRLEELLVAHLKALA